MIYLFCFYWVVTGFALYLVPSGYGRKLDPAGTFFVCLLIGGVAVPAKLITKVIS